MRLMCADAVTALYVLQKMSETQHALRYFLVQKQIRLLVITEMI